MLLHVLHFCGIAGMNLFHSYEEASHSCMRWLENPDDVEDDHHPYAIASGHESCCMMTMSGGNWFFLVFEHSALSCKMSPSGTLLLYVKRQAFLSWMMLSNNQCSCWKLSLKHTASAA
jgi:hypothetical protein